MSASPTSSTRAGEEVVRGSSGNAPRFRFNYPLSVSDGTVTYELSDTLVQKTAKGNHYRAYASQRDLYQTAKCRTRPATVVFENRFLLDGAACKGPFREAVEYVNGNLLWRRSSLQAAEVIC